MCGIIGYIGAKRAQPILLEGLANLEYRGYDSAGIAVMDGGTLGVEKTKGRIQILREHLRDHPLCGSCGIGHTRWATHGEPCDANAHPHLSADRTFAVVHNGIIENYRPLRQMLEQEGVVFASDTDTEVIAHLLCRFYQGDMKAAIRRVLSMMEGSWAVGVLCTAEPDRIYCTRRNSPLVLGIGAGENYIASDVPALLPYTRDMVFLKDDEIVCVTVTGIELFDCDNTPVDLVSTHITWSVDSAEKGGYEHFMLKEIHEEPSALERTLHAHVDLHAMEQRASLFPVSQAKAQKLRRIVIAACGTAYHAALAGKYIIEQLSHIPVEVDIASEFRYRSPVLSDDTLCIAVSQSGETADTLAAMREAARHGAQILAVTNVVGSSIAREAGDCTLFTHAGPEIAVASTKAYITQVEILTLLAIDLAKKRGVMQQAEAQALLQSLGHISANADEALTLEHAVASFARTITDVQHVFFIGRGLDYALAMEASLKLKEVSYIFTEAYAAGELKHGTIALIEPGTLVCAIITQSALADKTLSNVREVRTRGARILMVTTDALYERVAPEADLLWRIPDSPALLTPLTAIIPLQLLAYYVAVSRGCDVDKPRNLAKSVTVE